MKINVLLKHDVDPELRDYLEKVKTYNSIELLGDHLMIVVEDIDYLISDIRKIAREVEKVNKILKEAGFPWMARDVLDGKATIINGEIIYLNKSKLRKEIEDAIGRIMSDEEFFNILHIVTRDILVNRWSQGKKTDITDLIKIAAQSAKALERAAI